MLCIRRQSLNNCTFELTLTAGLLVDKDGVIISVYNSHPDAVLGLYFAEKPEELALYGCLAVNSINPSVAAEIVSIKNLVLLTVVANRLEGSDDVHIDAM